MKGDTTRNEPHKTRFSPVGRGPYFLPLETKPQDKVSQQQDCSQNGDSPKIREHETDHEQDAEKWGTLANDTWECASSGADRAAENPRKTGTTVGGLIPGAVTAASAMGGSAALSGTKKQSKRSPKKCASRLFG